MGQGDDNEIPELPGDALEKQRYLLQLSFERAKLQASAPGSAAGKFAETVRNTVERLGEPRPSPFPTIQLDHSNASPLIEAVSKVNAAIQARTERQAALQQKWRAEWEGGTSPNAPPQATMPGHPTETAVVDQPAPRVEVIYGSWKKEGQVWVLGYDGKSIHSPHRVGLVHILTLLRRPGTAVEAPMLLSHTIRCAPLNEAGIPKTDAKTTRDVRERLELCRQALGKAGIAEKEKDELKTTIANCELYLKQTGGFRGQPRKDGATSNRARTAATNSVRRAIKAIQTLHPPLAAHLLTSIRMGVVFCYQPTSPVDWEF